MKITCDRERMLAAFQIAASVAPKNSPKPILSKVKLDARPEAAVLSATDMEIGVRIEVGGVTVQQPGVVVLPVEQFNAILRESSDPSLALALDGEQIEVRGAASDFRLPTVNPREFPAVPEFKEEKHHEISAARFRELVRRTVFCADNQNAKYALGGVLLEMEAERLVAVATDGRRLAKMECAAKSVGGHLTGDATTIVPTKSMQLMERALGGDDDHVLQITARLNDVQVRGPGLSVYSRLVEGRFPRWRDVFPQRRKAHRVDFLVGPLHAAVRQAAIAADTETNGVDLTFTKGKLVLSGEESDRGASRIDVPIAHDGPEVVVTLSHRFLTDFLKVLDPTSTVTVEIENPDAAVLCTSGDGYGYVIMPLARDRKVKRKSAEPTPEETEGSEEEE